MLCSSDLAQQEGPGVDSRLVLDWVSSCPVTTGMDTVGGLEGEKRDYHHFLGFLSGWITALEERLWTAPV